MARYIDAEDFANRMAGVYEEYMWEVLEDTPTANVVEVPRWIPVTERLPEKDGMFLVSISPSFRMEKRVDTDFYSHFGVWQIFGEFVTAWCELPEPYGKETEDGRDTE